MALTGFELTPSESPTNEIRSLTTVPHSDWIILELKKIILKAFFSPVNAVWSWWIQRYIWGKLA